ncbi:hypothetical protein OC25_18610 [Pedobacter kyungheensis]|uniref:Uncharacterized protein n=1 Tax=Pedobacter kyungheensis TaxID=1069985 RepID=A0A0C1FW65_9SPHI|nr:hypothetical protein OC25_18610 [Pedobacter kyungheensis]
MLLVPLQSANSGSSGSAPFVIVSGVIFIFIIGTFTISILNIFLFKVWVKKYWFINGTITLLSGSAIGYLLYRVISINS